jgi:hypothetical protein
LVEVIVQDWTAILMGAETVEGYAVRSWESGSAELNAVRLKRLRLFAGVFSPSLKAQGAPASHTWRPSSPWK